MTPADILTRTAAVFGVLPTTLAGRSRSSYLVQARQAAMYALRQEGLSLLTIGELLERDHTTVLHGVQAAASRSRADPRYAAKLAAVLVEPATQNDGRGAEPPAAAALVKSTGL